MVCGCSYSYKLGDDSSNNTNRNRRETGVRRSEKSDVNKKQSKQTGDESSDDDAAKSNENEEADDGAANDSKGAEKNSAGGDMERLAGKWVWSRTGGGTYTDGGSYLGGNGSRFTYEFSGDGEVKFTGIMNVMQGGCRMQIFQSKEGEASLDGDTLTIDWSPTDFTRDDSCDTAGNYQKKLPAENETLQVAFKKSSGQNQLCLTGKDESCFSPAE